MSKAIALGLALPAQVFQLVLVAGKGFNIELDSNLGVCNRLSPHLSNIDFDLVYFPFSFPLPSPHFFTSMPLRFPASLPAYNAQIALLPTTLAPALNPCAYDYDITHIDTFLTQAAAAPQNYGGDVADAPVLTALRDRIMELFVVMPSLKSTR